MAGPSKGASGESGGGKRSFVYLDPASPPALLSIYFVTCEPVQSYSVLEDLTGEAVFSEISNWIMASVTTRYPRATIRKIAKGHARKNVSRKTDALIYLDYILFIEEYPVQLSMFDRGHADRFQTDEKRDSEGDRVW